MKVESLGDKNFVSKFALQNEKMRIFFRGLWHFDRLLIILTKPVGVGVIKKQACTHTFFFVHIHNISIMCVDKKMVRKNWQGKRSRNEWNIGMN